MIKHFTALGFLGFLIAEKHINERIMDGLRRDTMDTIFLKQVFHVSGKPSHYKSSCREPGLYSPSQKNISALVRCRPDRCGLSTAPDSTQRQPFSLGTVPAPMSSEHSLVLWGSLVLFSRT